MDWFNIDIDEQGIEYQVAFLFAELLAVMFGCHDDCFAYARNKELWYEGPYDKHMIKLADAFLKATAFGTTGYHRGKQFQAVGKLDSTCTDPPRRTAPTPAPCR